MVRCEECLRANPPTRVTCLYCNAPLPSNAATANLQKPSLRPLEKWEQGYNTILLTTPANGLNEATLADAADLLKLSQESLKRIIASNQPMPLTRTATFDEASLLDLRLNRMGLKTIAVSDKDLGIPESPPHRVRALQLDDSGMNMQQTPDAGGVYLRWSELSLLIVGRLIARSVELQERHSSRAEHEILDASEILTDVAVVDIYAQTLRRSFRILANSFDYSCLGEEKSLLAEKNFSVLLQLTCRRAPQTEYDDAYNSLRLALEAAWPAEQQTMSRGWRRERPGKYSVGAVTETSSENQFTRYSRLRYYLKQNPPEAMVHTNEDT